MDESHALLSEGNAHSAAGRKHRVHTRVDHKQLANGRGDRVLDVTAKIDRLEDLARDGAPGFAVRELNGFGPSSPRLRQYTPAGYMGKEKISLS